MDHFDTTPARIFVHEMLALPVSEDLVSPETEEKILSWRHSGFNVHSKVRTTTSQDARGVARYETSQFG
jgi:hypothetical protein